MGFVHEVEVDFDEQPFCDGQRVHIIEFALGYDLDKNEAAIMSVMLVPGASYLRSQIRGVYDLKFGIRTRDLDHTWKVSEPDFEVETVRRYIRNGDRASVLACVVRAVEALVRHVRPSDLTMVTFYSGLPDKALLKFQRIISALGLLGYQVQDAFVSSDGKHSWHLKGRIDGNA